MKFDLDKWLSDLIANIPPDAKDKLQNEILVVSIDEAWQQLNDIWDNLPEDGPIRLVKSITIYVQRDEKGSRFHYVRNGERGRFFF